MLTHAAPGCRQSYFCMKPTQRFSAASPCRRRPPGVGHQRLLGRVLGRARQLRGTLRLDDAGVEGLRVGGAVIDMQRQVGLVDGIDRLVEEADRGRQIGRVLEDAERGALQDALIVGESDLGAFLGQRADAAVPGHHHVDFPVIEELRRLRARGPPHRDVGLDLLELLEGAVDVERIELVGRDAVGHQRRLERGDRVIAQRAAARELLHVPEIGPAIGRRLRREFLLAVGEHARIELIGHRIGGTIGLGHRGAIRQFREIELFEQALLAAAQAIAGRHVDHIPGRLAAGDLRFDRGPGVGDAVLVDGDAKFLG